jgi:hypothetical protein
MTETQRPARPKLSLFRKSAPAPADQGAAPARPAGPAASDERHRAA